jgi:hypothetical protein
MRNLLVLPAIFALFMLYGCPSSMPYFPPEREWEWVVPADISGRWASEILPESPQSDPDKDIIRDYLILRQDGQHVSGEFIEFRRDGSTVGGPVQGTYDMESGVLTLTYYSITYGYSLTNFYRFSSDNKMRLVSEYDIDSSAWSFERE